MSQSSQNAGLPSQEVLKQYHAVRKRIGLFNWSGAGLIKVIGADRHSFLNYILTNDILNLKPGKGCRAMLLTATAKILADINVLAFADYILLLTNPKFTAQTLERLNKFLITEDAGLEIWDGPTRLSLQGPKSEELLKTLGLPTQNLKSQLNHESFAHQKYSGILIKSGLYAKTGYEIIIYKNGHAFLEEVLRAGKDLGLEEIGQEAEEILRVENGVLKFGVDFNEETMLPETGLEKIAASETKGCYPGQEVVAKIATYGRLNRIITGFIYDTNEAVKPKDKIFAEDKEAGFITSNCYSPELKKGMAMGLISKKYLESQGNLSIISSGKRISAKPFTLRQRPVFDATARLF